MTIRGLHSGHKQTAGIGLKMYSNDELEKIHLATLEVLWNVGVKVESPQAVQIFDGGGCSSSEKGDIVKIPAHIVEDSIRSIPPTFKACGRDASKDFVCEKDRVGFVNFGEAPRMIDPETRKLRNSNCKDVDEATRFLDALDQVGKGLGGIGVKAYVGGEGKKRDALFYGVSVYPDNGGVGVGLTEQRYVRDINVNHEYTVCLGQVRARGTAGR